MRFLKFFWVLIRVYMPIPPEYMTDVSETEADSYAAYDKVKLESDHNKIWKFLKFQVGEALWFRMLALVLIIPVGNWIRNWGKPKDETKKSLKEILEELEDNG